MLQLRTFSKYLALIMFAFFLSLSHADSDNSVNNEVPLQTDNSGANSDAENNETQDGSLGSADSSKEAAPEKIESLENIQSDSSESPIFHWTTLLVIFLVLASLILVVIYSLFDVKHVKGPVFKVSRKKSESPSPKPSKQNPNPDLKESEPEVQIPSSDINGHIAQQSQNINELKKDLANLLKTIDDMNLTFLTLKDNLDQKDEELARYKDGYDATIFKNFILRFTRVDKVLKENINDQNFSLGALEDVQIQMEDALAECNIEIFSPTVGDDYQTADGIADNPKQIETTKKGDNLKIAEIIQPGYRRKLPGNDKNDFQIITEAKVAIYIYKDN